MVRVLAAGTIMAFCLCVLIVRMDDPSSWIVHAQGGSVVSQETPLLRPGYAGDEACLPCHKEQAISYRQTSHHLTSQLPDERSILGSFKAGGNVLMIANPENSDVDPRLLFEMDKKEGGYYETAVAERGAQKLTHSERIDLVIGSGVRGQTYLYWAGNELSELPVSYWSVGKQWINSPGYKDGTANFSRHVDPRCLECHTTYIRPLSSDPQTYSYDKDSLVTGVSCENCHGPGAKHATHESADPASASKRLEIEILNPKKFPRDRQVDQCALCHNGTEREELASAFSYLPGRPLDQYLTVNSTDVSDRPDVHGNQVGLLKKSRCYLSSPSMSCATCHDVHRPERAAAEYSDRCLGCHQWKSCGLSRTKGVSIVHDCVDCHMPLQQTNAIVSVTAGRVLHASIRSHWIKVYPVEEHETDSQPDKPK
jgi:Cytochrome c554 and c-prime